MSNAFDPASFLNTEINANFETSFTPIPEGEFQAQVLDVTPKVVPTKNGDRVIASLKWGILDQGVADLMKIDSPSVKQDLWIDMEDNGALSTGTNKNIQLGHIREVFKQNDPSRPWSFAMLAGGVGTVRIKHTLDDKQNIRAEVAAVTAAK